MEKLHALMKLGNGLEVLYIEDDQPLQEETKNILERIFGKVEVASDGESGLQKFTSKHFDLIITDIEMPNMDGLEMARAIKSDNGDIPIIVISAYSHTEYLMEAIAIGINFYVMKPITLPHLVDTLYKVVQGITDRRLAEEYRKQEIDASIRRSNALLFEGIVKASPNPVIVCRKGEIAFSNEAFDSLFTQEEIQALGNSKTSLKRFLDSKISIDTLFEQKHSFVASLDDEVFAENIPLKIPLKTERGRKIYLLIRSRVQLGDGEADIMYTFNDITDVEYQRLQIDRYNEVMTDLTASRYRFEEAPDAPEIINKVIF
jgi:YesN/AraC family two-component response regulator